MRPLHQHHSSIPKNDYHPKSLFTNSLETTHYHKNNHTIEWYFKLNQHHNWWEEIGHIGDGKLRQAITADIADGIFEYMEDNHAK